MTKPRVLVIDDDYGASAALQRAFTKTVDPERRCEFVFCSGQVDGKNTLECVLTAVASGWPPAPQREYWSLVLLDVAFFQAEPQAQHDDATWGFDVLEALRERWEDLPVVMLTGQRDAKARANWTNADGFLEKPDENAPGSDRSFLMRLYSFGLFPDLREGDRLVGNTLVHLKTLREARQFACEPLGSGRIFYGETGTGKTELARMIHDEMAFLVNRTGAFHAWSAAGSNQDLASSALFGHWRGAHSLAEFSDPGRIELAHGGTFFLDEVASLSPALQALFIESRRRQSRSAIASLLPAPAAGGVAAGQDEGQLFRILTRMGKYPRAAKDVKEARESVVPGALLLEDHRIAVDVVMITATNLNLHNEEVAEALGFRRDLLNDLGSPVFVPGLNERREDIPEIFGEVVRRITRDLGRPERGVEDKVFEELKGRDWTNRNIVALRQIAEHAVLASRDFDEILLRHLPAHGLLRRWPGDRPRRPRALVEIAGGRVPTSEGEGSIAPDAKPRTVDELTALLSAFEAPLDRDNLHGALPRLQEAYARLVLRLFGAALRATRNQRGETSTLLAIRELLGVSSLKNQPQSQAAYDALLRMLELANVTFASLSGQALPVFSDDPEVQARVEQALEQRRKGPRKSKTGTPA